MSVQRLWKCYACPGGHPKGFDFQAEKPVCPKCGNDGANHENGMAYLTTPRVVIHYIPPPRAGTPKGYVACTKTRVGNGMRASGEIPIVNCPACMVSDEYTGASVLNVPPEYAVPPMPVKTQEIEV